MEFELTKGVAGSRKTQYVVDRAVEAGKAGDAANILFLVKVGSNANEIRSRMERQHSLVFKRHGTTNHWVARAFGDDDEEGSKQSSKRRRRAKPGEDM